ncbi:MAG TPA: prepilin-type N-terminal cleavage/methylation domain-containing protein, partial [Phycisphaerae bacterium]|nr:prepilin-type N-terminal cleavage/methylation domain-containing protein [Phycisphaerae bacterium]
MRAGVARKTAFSLAEMMIALVILGFGLLVIGAALPVGLQYERDMIDRATGQAAAEYALDVIEQRIRLVRDPYDETLGKPSNYADIFQPRYGEVTSLRELAPGGQSGELA